MNVALWVAQIFLAAVFGGAGLLKVTKPKDELARKLPYVEDYSDSTIRFIGVVEVLAAIGLVLPAVTGIAPSLTPLAAVGLAVIMVLAIRVHTRRREAGAAFNVVLLLLAVFVAWGRFGPHAFWGP